MKKRKPAEAKVNDIWATAEMSPVFETALYYGFNPVEHFSISKIDKENAKTFISDYIHSPEINPEEKIAILRTYFGKGMPPLPLMVFSEKSQGNKKDQKMAEYHFDIVGTTRSIADATVLKTVYEIAHNDGYDELEVEVNSVGDRDSLNRFSRELASYFRKHLNDLHPDCRQRLKRSPFSVLINCNHDKCKLVLEQAPKSMNFLSEPSRLYFMEVLELLETVGIPYTINSNLVGNPEFASHIEFKIYGKSNDGKNVQLAACGGRWSGLAKRMGFKKDIPGVSAKVFVKKHSKQDKKHRRMKKPQLYFIQMGNEAKLKSLILIETLRQARIPVYHSLTKDKLTAQLASAEHLRVPYILIMGQKESMENTVLVREMNNRSQDTIRMSEMADYLKKLLK